MELTAQIIQPGDGPADTQPQSYAAEQAVLGGLLLAESPDVHDEVSEILTAQDFFSIEHQTIYKAFLDRMQQGDTVDVVAIADALARENALEKIGGLAYLQELADSTPMVDIENLRTYSRLVFDTAMRRRLIRAGRKIMNSCLQPEGQSWEELLEQAEHTILRTSESHEQQDGLRPMGEVLRRTLDEIQSICKHNRELTGLETGFPWLDRTTSGLQKSDLVILAGRPSTGKTALAMNIVQHAMTGGQKQPVVVFSIEMSDIALTQRLLSSESGVPLFRIRNGMMNDGEYLQLEETLEKLKDKPFFLDTSTSLSPVTVRRRLRRIKGRLKQPPALVMVDYLQLMSASPGVRAENRNLEVAQISREMKALAKEFSCPVLLLSQLSRGAERANRAPNLADLRDSGAIEQDADLVLLLHPATENAQSITADTEKELPPQASFAQDREIILRIAKHRNGPIGKRHLRLHGGVVRFEELEQGLSEEDNTTL